MKQAAAIVVGRVLAIEARQEGGLNNVWTYVTIAREEVWKGVLTPRELVLKQPGGRTPDAHVQIDGSPEFTVGERVLLFLTRNQDGTPRVAHLSQGKFAVFTDQDTGRAFAYRDPSPPGVQIVHAQHSIRGQEQESSSASEATVLATNGFFELVPLKRRVRTAIAAQPIPAAMVSANVPPPTEALVETRSNRSMSSAENGEAVREVRAQFTLLTTPGARWFEPDDNVPVRMFANFANAPSFAQSAILQAIQAWNGVSGSKFRFEFGGAATLSPVSNAVNTISFEDPRNEIDQPINCSGVFGMTRVYISSDTRQVGNAVYSHIIEGDTVFADGWKNCPSYSNQVYWAETMTHELGYVLGLGHSTDPHATMYATAHNDARGASLTADDIAGVRTLYSGSETGGIQTCTLSLAVTNSSVGYGTSALNVNATPPTSTCAWAATSNADWITVTAGASGTGARTVSLSIAANILYQVRTGTVTIGDKTLTITQAAKPRRKRRV